MPTETMEERLKAYRADKRTACQYGNKCYQKNPAHHTKYKHPPEKQQENAKKTKLVVTGRKRSSSECNDDEEAGVSILPQTKMRKDNTPTKEIATHSLSPSPSPEPNKISDEEIDGDSSDRSPKNDSSPVKATEASDKETQLPKKESPKKQFSPLTTSPTFEESKKSAPSSPESPVTEEKKKDESEEPDSVVPSTDPKKIISDLFLVKMPDDFYEFYEFCKSVNAKDPTTALKLVDLKLVGPYDVLNGKIKTNKQKEPEKFLRHWRYFYDPPEFQTILKGNDKQGLHYGYWRDSAEEEPTFVAKNNANTDCKIIPVAPNIFGAVNSHIDERLKKANPFEKGPMLKIWKQLKTFAKDKNIQLETDNSAMQERRKKLVTKTFHGAGIVVPYDTKTQLGYRDLAATDNQLKRIISKLDEADSDDERKKPLSQIEEVVRLAVIAADEYDFGTCLELGHDLFSSGCKYVQRTGLRVLSTAYNLLKRQKLLKIAEAHAKDRKKGCDLSVL